MWLMKLILQTVRFAADVMRMLIEAGLSVNGLYSIVRVDWLVVINFSSTTALRLADLERLPSNNTMGPVNAKSLQGVRKNHSEQTKGRMGQTTLEAFLMKNVRGEDGFERPDSMLQGLVAGWTASFLALKNLPRTLLVANTRIPQGHYGIIHRSDPGTVCDSRIRKLQKRTSSAADRRNTEAPTGRTPDIDCKKHKKWEKLVKVDDFKPLPQQMRENVKKIDMQKGSETNAGSKTYSNPLPVTKKLLRHGEDMTRGCWTLCGRHDPTYLPIYA